MSQRSRLSWCMILATILVVGIASAQERPDDPRWNIRSSVQMATPSTDAIAVPNRDFRPNTTPRVYTTPIGTMVVEPNIRPRPNTGYHQSEVMIAAQANNRNIMFGASHNIRSGTINVATFITTNGGVTWYGRDTLADFNTQRGDPAPIIDKDGVFLYGHLNSSTNFGAVTGMGMNRSTNRGITFEPTIPITNAGGSDADKNLMGTDDSPSSPFYGNSYMAWTKFTAGNLPAVILMTRTTNNGVSWSPAIQVNQPATTTFSQGADVAVNTNGTVFISWAEESSTSPFPSRSVGLGKSTDGGVTWTYNNSIYPTSGMRSSSFNGWAVRVNDFPRIAIDKTGGPRNNWIYIIQPEQGGTIAGTDADITFRRSTDGGTTWSAGVRVNQDTRNNGKVQFFPAIAVDAGGGINVVYYDNRNYPSVGDSCEIYMSRSLDGGDTWTDIKVSDHSFRPKNVPGVNSMGDYIGIAAGNGKVWPMWMDDRSGFYDVWTSGIITSENFGWLKGVVTNLSGGAPVSGVALDFTQNVPQIQSSTLANGSYLVGARVDTPGTTANLTLRARKFGFIDTTISVTLTRNDTATRNFSIRPAPGGTLSVRAYRAPSINMKAYVSVTFGGQTVISDSTDPGTGLFTAPLPTGTYVVRVDPPSPYATRVFNNVVITAGATTNVDALLRAVFEFNPTSVRDTLPVNGSRAKTLAITNTTPDTVRFRITDDNALARAKRTIVPEPAVQEPAKEKPKGAADTEFGQSPEGRGGPDAFGYQWIDSDEPGGPVFNWFDISTIGTEITTFTGSRDDGHAQVTLPWAFPLYGNNYTVMNVVTNGFMNFGTTSTAFTNGAIPSTAAPNNALYAFWDDMDLRTSGKIFYYNDSTRSRFIVQYDKVPRFGTTAVDTLTFQVMLRPNGEILYQYLRVRGNTLNSATIGIENAAGTVGLQVVFNAAYVKDSLATRFYLPDAPWLSQNPVVGAIAPNGTQNIQVTFDATGLTAGTTYNANMFVEATHPDVTSPFTVPASLRVQPADSALLVLNKTSITFPGTVIGNVRRDTINARNAGGQTLNVTSITTNNTRFTVSPSNATIAPGNSVNVVVTYTPVVPAGTDTGRVIFISNSQGGNRRDVTLTGTAVGAPRFQARVDSLTKTLQARGFDSTRFFVRNTGTLNGNFNARAVMYPRTTSGDQPAEPVVVPMAVRLETPAVYGDGSSAERSPVASTPTSGQSPQAQWDLQFNYDANTVTGAAGNAAAIFINNTFWTSRWATNVLHRWNANGTLIEQFTITGVTGVRGLTTDGTFLYASSNSATIYKIDPVTKTLVSTITCPSPVTTRVIVYDPVRDGFWVSNFADALTCVSRTGTVIATIPNTLAAKYGGAYDSYTPGGPYLWVFDQTNTAGGTPQNVWQFNLTTLTATGVSFDILTRVTNGGTAPIAGGLFIATGIVPGKVTIGGMLQGGGTGALDRLFGLELADAGAVSGPWLSVAPTSGTIAIGDSTRLTAYFDARNEAIINNPGTYYGRIEITATNSALAESLNIPARFTVTPVSGAAMIVTPDSAVFTNVPIGVTDSSKTVLVKNIGTSALNITNITISNPAFSVNRTSFSLNSQDTLRLRIRFTGPSPAGVRTGTLTFVSNDPSAPTVRLRGTSIGQARIVVVPDSFSFSRTAGTDTTRASLRIRNTGSDTLRYAINEALSSSALESVIRSQTQQQNADVPKGGVDPTPPQPASPEGRGGPDAFGYTWIDSDEPGGPAFNWFDISTVGTRITTWTGSADDGYATVPLPFAFSFYGANQSSVNIVTNGFINFGATSSAFSNGAIPSTAAPNNAIYALWDDMDLRDSGAVYYYHDAANSRFVIQYHRVPHYALGGETGLYTFQVMLYANGNMLVQYLNVQGTLTSNTVGIENAGGTVGLQVVFNSAYIANNKALLFTKDLIPWLSTSRTEGVIAPADSQTVQVQIHPLGLNNGVYNARLLVTGNTPDTGRVAVRLQITGGAQPTVTVTAPNGGENWTVGSVRQIIWTHTNVDTVKIEYSTSGPGGPWTLITGGVPARPMPGIHPKGLVRAIEGSMIPTELGTFNWTVPNTPSTNAYVRVSQKSNAAVFDISNAAFTIAPAGAETSWVAQTSGTTATLYTVKAVDHNIVWAAGAGGVVMRTTNGGANWTSVGGGAIGTADIYAIEARDATTAFATTSPGATFIYRTTNGGATWTQVYTLATAFINAIGMVSATEGYAEGDPVGGKWLILKTTDGGATWARMATEPTQVGTEAGWNNSMQIRGSTIWFGTNASRVYRSTNLGATWTSGATTTANSYAVWFNSATLGMISGASGATNRSTDGGVTWTAGANAGTGTFLGGIGSVSGSEFWTASGAAIFHTLNHGTGWSSAAPNGHTGSQTLNHLQMVAGPSGSTWGWAVGNAGTIVRYRRTSLDVTAGENVPTVYALDQNYPNPFNPTTTIRFSLPEEATVSLKVYNLLGQEVVTLAEGEMSAAFHNVVWNGRNASGSPVASGMYFYRIDATGVSGTKFTSLKKLILLK